MIAKIGDTGSEIVLANPLTSITSTTGVNATLNGTGSFSANGFDAGSAGSLSFTINDTDLAYEGQIVTTIPLVSVTMADESVSVSGSRGDNKAANYCLWSSEDSGGTDLGRMFVGTDNRLEMRTHSGDTPITVDLTSIGKGDAVEVCSWWDGTRFGIMIDGSPVVEGTRSARVNAFHKLIVGARWDETGIPFNGYDIKDLVVSRNSPRLIEGIGVGIFGDSFAAQALSAINTPLYDARMKYPIERKFSDKGYRVNVFGAGYGSHTVCDTGSDDLEADGDFDTYAATLPEFSLIMATNNDVTSTTAEVEDGTNGTDAHLKEWITTLSGNGYTKRVYVFTPGSLRQNEAIDTAANNTRRGIVDAIVQALPAWWDAANPTRTGFVHVVDLFTLLGGDAADNVNYKGYWNGIGNIAYGGSASPTTPDDRHPHSSGHVILADYVSDNILKAFFGK